MATVLSHNPLARFRSAGVSWLLVLSLWFQAVVPERLSAEPLSASPSVPSSIADAPVEMLRFSNIAEAIAAADALAPKMLAQVDPGYVPEVIAWKVKGIPAEPPYRKFIERLIAHGIKAIGQTLDPEAYVEKIRALATELSSEKTKSLLISYSDHVPSPSEINTFNDLLETRSLTARCLDVLREVFARIGDKVILEKLYVWDEAGNRKLRLEPDKELFRLGTLLGGISTLMVGGSFVAKEVMTGVPPSALQIAGYSAAAAFHLAYTFMATLKVREYTLVERGEPSIDWDENDPDGDQLLKDESELRAIKLSIIRQLLYCLPMTVLSSALTTSGIIFAGLNTASSTVFSHAPGREQGKAHLRWVANKGRQDHEAADRHAKNAFWSTMFVGGVIVPILVAVPLVFGSVGVTAPLLSIAMSAGYGSWRIYKQHRDAQDQRVSTYSKAVRRLQNGVYGLRGGKACAGLITIGQVKADPGDSLQRLLDQLEDRVTEQVNGRTAS